jgi:hypothetical protein
MIICNPRSLAFAMLIAALPVGFAFAGGSGGRGGAIGGGVGAVGMGSAAVGGGAGRVGGGAGAVGGGLPGADNPAGNGAAGMGNPSLNAVGGGPGGNGTNTPGIPNARTNGSVIGGDAGVPSPSPSPFGSPGGTLPEGGTSPEASSEQSRSTATPTAPKDVQGVAEQAPLSPTGLAEPGPDGVSTVIVAARPCGVAARETDGTTTCIGIPDRSPNLSRSHHRRVLE